MGREINNFMEKNPKYVKEEFKDIFQCQISLIKFWFGYATILILNIYLYPAFCFLNSSVSNQNS